MVADGTWSHHMRSENENVYVEWSNLDRRRDAARFYNIPANERELEDLRLEWSHLRGRSVLKSCYVGLMRRPGQEVAG